MQYQPCYFYVEHTQEQPDGIVCPSVKSVVKNGLMPCFGVDLMVLGKYVAIILPAQPKVVY